ncbi:hypothetical protein [Acidipropionibacterium timonense]|uniref:hypothetical protein n=1 Tax=Acidipropionibacterium timonense TaxID=2161818 RepID=UPI001032307D|nr:hypothetical protein [Acidipropionibacterium timonense]
MNEQNLTIARAVGATAAGVRRRTIVRGVAWTLPAISLVTAAPAFATSSECTYTIDFSANASSASWTPLTHLSGTSPTGDVVTVGLQSTPASCTQTTYFNMTSMSNAALAGVSNYGADPACSEEQQPTGAPWGGWSSTSMPHWRTAVAQHVTTTPPRISP